MLRDDLRPHTFCEIRPVEMQSEDVEKNSGQVYTSEVIRVNPDETIDFSIPTLMGNTVDLVRNTRYSFLFNDDRSLKSAHGVFLQRIRIDNVPMAKVKLVTPLKKIQRRDYFRIGCRIELHFQVIPFREEDLHKPGYLAKISEAVKDNPWKQGTILDISGGGMKFVSEAPILDLPYIYATFVIKLPEGEKRVGMSGKILSRQPVPRTLLCTHRVKFVPEHSKGQDDILAFVFAEQRKLARKEQGLYV